ncbi:unnamed protein product [Adineta steineri]|uniref:HTH CENPB-type domain-containing protein n=1 Tax=Adineta steineri TaxID=433720 RepID=A0A815UFD8_9BILA|nr:unnamed protein product [Adineta steineri]
MPRKYKKKKKTKTYVEDDFRQALEQVDNGSRSVRNAVNYFHIPFTTLNSHVNKLVVYEEVGRPTKFNQLEEQYLQETAFVLQSWGKPLSIEEFLDLAKRYAASLNKGHLFPSESPSYDWLRSFLKRHQNLVLKKSRPLEKKRASVTIEQVYGWHNLLTEIINDNDLVNRPGQIYNCDETGMSDSVSYSKVLVHRQSTNSYRTQGGSGGRAYTTVIFCGSATGHLLPPFVIYKSKRLFQEWCTGGPPDAGYSNSENGWIDQQLFYEWFDQIFLKHTKDLPRPLVLIVDGHGSHFKVETLKLAVQNEVIILCLPSNATHILQPLDLVFFNPLKIEGRKVLKNEYKRTQDKNIGKAQFPTLLSELWKTDAIGQKTNLIKSFMRAGVFPLNKQAIDVSRIVKSATSSSSIDIHQNNKTNTTPSSSTIQSTVSNPLPLSGPSNSTQFNTSSFATSQRAISILKEVLDNTALNDHSFDNSADDTVIDVDVDGNDNSDDNDDDHDVVVNNDNSDDDDDVLVVDNDDSDESYIPESSSKKFTKRKRSSSKTTSVDTTDDNDIQMNESYNKPTKSNIIQTSGRKNNELPKNSKQASTDSITKRRRVAFKLIGFDSSDEESKFEKCYVVIIGTTFLQYILIDIPPAKSQDSLTAIQDTLQTIFTSSSQAQATSSTKRTMLKQTNGKIMTETDVIEQIEEQQRKKNKKKPRATYRKTSTK